MLTPMDIELFYTKHGRGAPLLLLHGNGEDSAYFEHQIGEFSQVFSVYAIDTRGHGRSPLGTAPQTVSKATARMPCPSPQPPDGGEMLLKNTKAV